MAPSIIAVFLSFHWRRKWQPSPELLPGEFHGQRSRTGYSPWNHKELDTTVQLTFLSFIPTFYMEVVTYDILSRNHIRKCHKDFLKDSVLNSACKKFIMSERLKDMLIGFCALHFI